MSEETQVQEVPLDKLSQADYNAARDKGNVAVVEKEVEQEEEKKGDEKPKKSGGGFQKKIDRLVKHNSTLEEQVAASARRIQELEAKNKPEEKREAAPVSAEKPLLKDFTTHEEWVEAVSIWHARNILKSERESEAQQAKAAEQKEQFDAYNKRASEAMSRYDDFKEVVGSSDMRLPLGVGEAIIEMENGPDVAYHLGKNPELVEELAVMTNLKAIGRIWKLSEELSGKLEEEGDEAEEVEVEKPAPKVEAKKKYEPIKPVGGGSTKSSVPLDKVTSMSEYNRLRDAGRTR